MTTADGSDETRALVTVRDWWRFATTSFNRAGLVFGHGTSNARDEAAFLVLMALDLPIDALDPWLDARLLASECDAMARLIKARIETRKPASYLVKAAFMQGHRFYVDERVIVPRSYIGELLNDGLADLIEDPGSVATVLDLCTGSGCLAILAAYAFPVARIDALDISADALAVAERNVADHRMENRIVLLRSDLLSQIPPGTRYDLILANPPYVARAEVAAFDAEYRSEPVLAHLGGEDGLDLVRRIVERAGAVLNPGGWLILELGTGRERFEAAIPGLEVIWLDTAESSGEVLAVTAEALQRL